VPGPVALPVDRRPLTGLLEQLTQAGDEIHVTAAETAGGVGVLAGEVVDFPLSALEVAFANRDQREASADLCEGYSSVGVREGVIAGRFGVELLPRSAGGLVVAAFELDVAEGPEGVVARRAAICLIDYALK
jgi:hypothetical protein